MYSTYALNKTFFRHLVNISEICQLEVDLSLRFEYLTSIRSPQDVLPKCLGCLYESSSRQIKDALLLSGVSLMGYRRIRSNERFFWKFFSILKDSCSQNVIKQIKILKQSHITIRRANINALIKEQPKVDKLNFSISSFKPFCFRSGRSSKERQDHYKQHSTKCGRHMKIFTPTKILIFFKRISSASLIVSKIFNKLAFFFKKFFQVLKAQSSS